MPSYRLLLGGFLVLLLAPTPSLSFLSTAFGLPNLLNLFKGHTPAKDYKIEVVLKDTELPQGLHYSSATDSLYFVDTASHHFYRYDLSARDSYKASTDDRSPSFILPVEGKSNKFIVAYDSKLAHIKWDETSSKYKNLDTITDLKKKNSKARFSAGRCDPQGRLWAGTLGHNDETGLIHDLGPIYALDLQGNVQYNSGKIHASSGLAWSKDSSKLYVVDSFSYEILAFDFDTASGTIGQRRVVLNTRIKGIEGVPAGICVCEHDGLYVAMFGGSKVLHVHSLTGYVVDTIDFTGRASQISSVTFGGKDLDELYVASGTYGLTNAQLAGTPDAGAIFKVTGLGSKGFRQSGGFKGKID